MKTSLFIYIIILTLLTSCKSDNLREVLENSKTPKMDLAYYTVVKSELGVLGGSVSIVDRTLDTTSAKIMGIVPSYFDQEKIIYWKQEIFPRANYINGDNLEKYITGQSEKYWELRDKYKAGWIELTTPYFTQNKKKVLIEVNFFQGRTFGASSYYLLEWNGQEYLIKEKGLLSIS